MAKQILTDVVVQLNGTALVPVPGEPAGSGRGQPTSAGSCPVTSKARAADPPDRRRDAAGRGSGITDEDHSRRAKGCRGRLQGIRTPGSRPPPG